MRSWDSVKVTNEALEHHGQAGRVVSAEPFIPEGEKAPHVEVQLDADGTSHLFEVTDLQVL